MRIYLPIFAVIFLASCSPRPVSIPTPTHVSLPTSLAAVTTTSDNRQEKIIVLVIEDLSTRLSLDPQQVHILSVEPARWPDAALGCPRPGEVYAEQAELGYLIVLEANGQEYVYHTDTDQTVILCLEEELPSFPVTPGEIDDGQPWMPVD